MKQPNAYKLNGIIFIKKGEEKESFTGKNYWTTATMVLPTQMSEHELILYGGTPVCECDEVCEECLPNAKSKQIEKLDKLETPDKLPISVHNDNPITQIFYKQTEVCEKINELVEAVNHLQKG